MRTVRAYWFYRLLGDWESQCIDSISFQVRAVEMGMPVKQIDELIKWLETKTTEFE